MPNREQRKIFRLASQRAQSLEILSFKRQEIIRPVFENPSEFVLLNIRDMAARLATAPATIVRILRQLGFDGYKSFQHYLHELSVMSSTVLDNMQSTEGIHKMPKLLHRAQKQLGKNIESVTHGIDLNQIQAIAKRLHEAKRILLIGGDMASVLALYLEYHLIIAGAPAVASVTPGHTSHLTRSVGEHDVVLGISFRRGLRMTIEGIISAKEHGAYCIGITDSVLSPLASSADELLIVPTNSLSFAASYAAPIALIDLLTASLGILRRDKMAERLREADYEQKHSYRWYQSES